ncbi:uncharacterized protein [Nicotiana sylvestris]|uniref:uncharacterized protein n=1 Tax=Nicotiana sylvestris TaxID=4096 RepID=UPI00388C5654
MRIKTLEDAKESISNIDECIVEALNLETTAFENILARPSASSSSSTCSESSKTEEEVVDEEEKDKDEGDRADAEQLSPSMMHQRLHILRILLTKEINEQMNTIQELPEVAREQARLHLRMCWNDLDEDGQKWVKKHLSSLIEIFEIKPREDLIKALVRRVDYRMAPEDRSHLYDCYQRIPDDNGRKECPSICTAEGLEAIGKVPDIAKGEVDPNYADWFEKMFYVNNEPEPERPTKRSHVQAFDDKIQERLAWGEKEKEYKAIIHDLREELRNVTFNNELQAQEAEGRSRKDERLIYNLTQKVRDYEDDLQKAESELAKARARLSKSAEGRAAFIQRMKERYEKGVTCWEKVIGNLEGEMAKQAKNFKAEREHCYSLMARLERDLKQLQEQNQVAE